MSNLTLYEIKEEYKDLLHKAEEEIFSFGDMLEETGQALVINQEQLIEKITNYEGLMALLDSQEVMANAQIARAEAFKKRKQTIRNALEYHLLQALLTFGDEDKNGVRRLDAGTLQLATRKSSYVEIEDEDVIGDEYKAVTVKMPLDEWRALQTTCQIKHIKIPAHTETVVINKSAIKAEGGVIGAPVESRVKLNMK